MASESAPKKRKAPGAAPQFPKLLYTMLHHAESEGYSHIVSWLPHGRSFQIHNRQVFVDTILPRYFHQASFASFQRQLNLYGLVQWDKKGSDHKSYYHKYLRRGQPELLEKIVRTTAVSKTGSIDPERAARIMPPPTPQSPISRLFTDSVPQSYASVEGSLTTTTTPLSSLPSLLEQSVSQQQPPPSNASVFDSSSASSTSYTTESRYINFLLSHIQPTDNLEQYSSQLSNRQDTTTTENMNSVLWMNETTKPAATSNQASNAWLNPPIGETVDSLPYAQIPTSNQGESHEVAEMFASDNSSLSHNTPNILLLNQMYPAVNVMIPYAPMPNQMMGQQQGMIPSYTQQVFAQESPIHHDQEITFTSIAGTRTRTTRNDEISMNQQEMSNINLDITSSTRTNQHDNPMDPNNHRIPTRMSLNEMSGMIDFLQDVDLNSDDDDDENG